MIKKFVSLVLVLSVVVLNFGFISPRTASAAGTITAFTDTVSTLTKSLPANHTIQFTTPSGVAAGQTIILTFYNGTPVPVALDFNDLDVKVAGTDVTLGATATGATWGVANTSTTIITLTNGTTAVPPSSVINIEIGTHATSGATGIRQLTNNSVAGSSVLRISGTFNDVGSLSMAIVNDSVVVVSAEVLASLTFTISHNALYFGNLTVASNCFARNTVVGFVTCPVTTPTSAFDMTASTNGSTGYTISVQGDTLRSGVTNTITALAANTAASPGNEQFGLRMTVTTGANMNGTVSAPYAAAGYAYTGTIGTPATVATSPSASLSQTYSVTYLANIAALTEAGSYVTAHTYVATGNF